MADTEEGNSTKHRSIAVRVGYGAIFVLFVIFAWILRDYGQEILGKITLWRGECSSGQCFGQQGVLRISLSLFLFYVTMALIMIGKKSHDPEAFRTKLQDDLWIVKILFLVGLLVVSYLLPNAVFKYYGYICIGGATLFIFIQILVLVDFAYEWNEKWVSKEWYKPVIASSVVLYAISVTGIVLSYVWFAHGSSCGVNTFIVTFIVILGVVATYVSLRDDVEKGALLTSAVVVGYCVYLTFSALFSSTNHECNPFPQESHPRTYLLIIGVIIAIISICWNTLTSASQHGIFSMKSKEDESLLNHEDDCYNFSYFHLVFAFGSMYMAMLFTGWTVSFEPGQFDVGPISMWMKVASSWITIFLYIWSLVAPLLFPDREWS